MRKIYRKFKSNLTSKSEKTRITLEIAKQNLGYQIIQPLLIDYPYLPYNGGALRPFNISLLLNDIIINNRKIIVEFGSGISTILISRLIKRNNLDCQLISIESNTDWQKQLSDILKKEGVNENTEIHYAPLKEVVTPFGKGHWYDYDDTVFDSKKIDLVIIDGPPANLDELKHSRYLALPKVFQFLSEKYMIYLDDTNRAGEKEVIAKWESDFNIKFIHQGSNYSIYTSHDSFGTIPFQIK
jgi:hypothetical protein